MTRPRQQPQRDDPAPAKLTAPREDVANELMMQIKRGEQLRDREITGEDDLEAARSDYYTWNEYNLELLTRRFTTGQFAESYRTLTMGAFALNHVPLAKEIEDLRGDVQTELRRLKSVIERLPLVDEVPQVEAARATPAAQPTARESQSVESIFLVHGRDEAAKLAVHGFLREITDVPSVVLHLEANRGRTVLEKFEAVGSKAGFAVVLLTADDVGRLADDHSNTDTPRARQNVVWEFGFFVGALGRSHVVVLYEPGVELPSDLHGLLYIPLDDAGGWKLPLARELSAANITVDSNKLLSA